MRGLLAEFRLYTANRLIAFLPSHRLRLFYYRRAMKFEIGTGSSILMGCRFDCAGGLSIGENSTINDSCFLDTRGGIRIGNNTALTSGVWISTVKHDIETPDFAAIAAPVEIGDYVFVGRRATILQGCKLGAGAVLGAGSVLTKSIPDFEIWAGNPAKKISERKLRDLTYTCQYQRLMH